MSQPVVAAVVTSSLGVLIGKRVDRQPPWAFAGGKIEPRESAADAAVREVREETGLSVAAVGEIGNRVHPMTGRLMIYAACRPVDSTDVSVCAPDELTEVRWATLAEATTLLPGMFEPVRRHLQRELKE